MFRSVSILLVIGLGPLILGSAPVEKKETSVSFEQLIDRLADKNHRTRELAARSLIARGKEALPALRKAQMHPDAEVRRRLSEIIPWLERQVALAPKQITLHMEKKPL